MLWQQSQSARRCWIAKLVAKLFSSFYAFLSLHVRHQATRKTEEQQNPVFGVSPPAWKSTILSFWMIGARYVEIVPLEGLPQSVKWNLPSCSFLLPSTHPSMAMWQTCARLLKNLLHEVYLSRASCSTLPEPVPLAPFSLQGECFHVIHRD